MASGSALSRFKVRPLQAGIWKMKLRRDSGPDTKNRAHYEEDDERVDEVEPEQLAGPPFEYE
jgi:hypothetical protein